MLQETLKQATQSNHDVLEQRMFVQEIMSGSLSLQQYKQILTTNYLIHQAFETDLFNALSPELAEALNSNSRHKLAALVQDLEELQMPLPQTQYTVSFDKNDASLLGALYVLEGATLGGNVIVKRLKVNPNLNQFSLGFHYYQVYGDQLIPQWKSFCAVLNQQPEATYPAAVESAKKMFDTIARIQG